MSLRIVVINDNQTILRLFREILEGEGYEVFLYAYGSPDLDEIKQLKPDLIILDYIVGNEGPGWQVLQVFKMQPETATIPIIICTVWIRYVQEIEGSLNAKGVTIVTKPFEVDDLLHAVQAALRMNRHIPTVAVEADPKADKGKAKRDS
ncbi:MAG: response regulator [Anaerolineae bacterium]|nr:response regulator [Anaerolineae bacterium]